MNEKLSFQQLVEALSDKAGVSKKVADTFAKAFFDTIVESLYMGESSIKIKGLGTFKLVDVESRESVNVSNGERIVIPGYKKVSFTPDDTVVDVLNNKEEVGEAALGSEEVEEPVAENATAVEVDEPIVPDDESSEDIVPENDEATMPEQAVLPEDEAIMEEETPLFEVEEPENVEVPSDNLSGIDMLISTPESIEDVKIQYEKAKAYAAEMLAEARKAQEEKMRLEMLIERLEANQVPEDVVPMIAEVRAEESSDENAEVDAAAMEGPKAENAALDRLLNDAASNEMPKEQNEQKSGRKAWLWVIIALLVVALIGSIGFFLYKTSESIESVEKLPVKETVVSIPDSVVPADSVIASVTDSVKADVKVDSAEVKKAEPVKVQEPSKPEVHIMKSGESLTRISQKYYGTKDSVIAIIRLNNFPDPNNVPIGAKVKLP